MKAMNLLINNNALGKNTATKQSGVRQNVNVGNTSFRQLFIKSTDATIQNNLPQTMTIDKLMGLINTNKAEVFINHENNLINVTELFKAEFSNINSKINISSGDVPIAKPRSGDVPIAKPRSSDFQSPKLGIETQMAQIVRVSTDKPQNVKRNINDMILEINILSE